MSLENQFIQLLSIIKDIDNIEKIIDIYLQVHAINIINDEKKHKKIYNLSLCDNSYKYPGFIIANCSKSDILKKGSVLNLQKINPRRVKGGKLYILIRQYKIISEKSKICSDVKSIKEFNGKFIDEFGNSIISSSSSELDNENSNSSENDKSNFIDQEIKSKNNIQPKKEEVVTYTPLKQLTTFSRDFIIFVRVLKKSGIKVFETRNNTNSSNSISTQGKLFYFIVIDKDDNEIQVTCFNKAVDKFFDLIEEDKLYEIRGGYVKINDRKFSRSKSDYKIVLEENTIITKKSENGIIKQKPINITLIKDIQTLKLYSIINLCVIVIDVGEILMKNTRNGLQPLKKITVGDISQYKIELSLWRSHSQWEIEKGDILLLNNVKVGEFKGKNVSTFDETTIKKNPDLSYECVKNLDEFVKNKRYNLENYFLELENLNEIRAQKVKELEDMSFCTVYIKDVLEYLDDIDDVVNISKISATVTQIMHNEKNFYLGCNDKNCKRKLILISEEGSMNEEFFCPNCRRKTTTPNYYYTLSLRVKDTSCEQWIDIFGKTAESIMGYTAEDYKEILDRKEKDKLKEISDRIEFKEFNFWVKPKLQMFNMSSKKKLYAYRIEPVDKKSEMYKLVDYLSGELLI